MAALKVRITGRVDVDVALDGTERYRSLGSVPVTFSLVSADVEEEMDAGMLKAENGAVLLRLHPSSQLSLTLSEEVLAALFADEMVSGMRGLM